MGQITAKLKDLLTEDEIKRLDLKYVDIEKDFSQTTIQEVAEIAQLKTDAENISATHIVGSFIMLLTRAAKQGKQIFG